MPGCKALQLAHFDTSSAGTIAELRASSAEKSALLAAAEERLARLEALHSIAQACSTTHSCRTTSGIDHVEEAIHCSIHYQTPNLTSVFCKMFVHAPVLTSSLQLHPPPTCSWP